MEVKKGIYRISNSTNSKSYIGSAIAAGLLSQQKIAQIFEVSQRAISDIKTGKRFNFSV